MPSRYIKVVIQCAASKLDQAGSLRSTSGKRVRFVADTDRIPASSSFEYYARPDDSIDGNRITWRDELGRCNANACLGNALGLVRAADLYAPPPAEFRYLYCELADGLGWDNLFILSAGWGLISASYLVPDYDITFSSQVKKKKPWAWRDPSIAWRNDFNHLRDAQLHPDEEVHVFCGKDYWPMLGRLAKDIPVEMVVHFKGKLSKKDEKALTCGSFRFDEYTGNEKSRTWHYRAAKEFLARHLR